MARLPKSNRNPVVVFGAVALVVVLGLAALISLTDAPSDLSPEVTQRPTGAGTIPDGAVDEFQEGLRNTTSTEDFIDQSATGDAGVVPPLLDNEDAGPGPVTNAENLDSPDGEEPILDRIGATDQAASD